MPNNKEDLFLALRATLEEDLASTGFSPNRDPPGTEEPKIPINLRDLDSYHLKGLYDEFLAYYDYLSDQIAQDNSYTLIGKARLEFVTANATKKGYADKNLKNADMRKAAAITDDAVLGAQQDYTYFKCKLSVQRERRDKISKCLDRIGRELWFRTQDTETNSFIPRERKFAPSTTFSSKFKRVQDE